MIRTENKQVAVCVQNVFMIPYEVWIVFLTVKNANGVWKGPASNL